MGHVDACYMPRDSHTTGDILVHEMAYGENDELWVVNTRFSCLCTLDNINSFLPRWKPSFITGYSPNDRCHLNGLGMVDGKPKYVTALGETNTPTGWRDNKKDGEILIDIPSGEVIAHNLSMPHSPRWHNGQLWVLESGKGTLSVVDLKTDKHEAVATGPGFTRGLDFWGPLAFIGLSQARETAVFSGIPITEQNIARNSGIWIINIEIGQLVAFVRLEDALQEIFAVQILQGIVCPDLVIDEPEIIHSSYELPNHAMKYAETVNPAV
ncbi:TIGR03032 family protein [Cyanobium sp. BA5m-21]|uniref:TIGR03032 family protein n=1 Tax=Cyanobium sp. BA5m-21 TaxID=2823706 RepID=UPI003965671E